jgi:hypothetical protein
MNLATVASRATTGMVAGVAGFSSYRHIVEVAQRAGEHQAVAAVLPLSIDGLIVVGTMAMVEDKRAGRKPRLSARVALAFGVVATLAANIASAQPHLMSRCVAAVPAIAFLITVEVLARTGRIRDAEVSAAVSTEPPLVDPPKPIFQYARPIGPVPAPVDRVSTPPVPVRKPQPSSQERIERAHKRWPAETNQQLAERLNLSTKTVQRWRPKPDPQPTEINGNVPDLALAGHIEKES